jgi:hypothetical protein
MLDSPKSKKLNVRILEKLQVIWSKIQEYLYAKINFPIQAQMKIGP